MQTLWAGPEPFKILLTRNIGIIFICNWYYIYMFFYLSIYFYCSFFYQYYFFSIIFKECMSSVVIYLLYLTFYIRWSTPDKCSAASRKAARATDITNQTCHIQFKTAVQNRLSNHQTSKSSVQVRTSVGEATLKAISYSSVKLATDKLHFKNVASYTTNDYIGALKLLFFL